MSARFGHEFIAVYFKRAPVSEGRLAALLTALTQGNTHAPYEVWEHWLSPRGAIALISLGRGPAPAPRSWLQTFRQDRWPSAQEPQRIRLQAHGALLSAGYITRGARSWERSLRADDAGLTCEDAGGIAAFCLATCVPDRAEQLYLWSTRPGLRAIAWAESGELIVAGTRPRLVHAVARDFAAPRFDLAYLHASLTGWSLGDHTPYDGTALVPVDGLLRVREGVCSVAPHPTPAYQREALGPAAQTRLYRAALREAVSPLRDLAGFELRLSGGKDSRLVASILHDCGITPSTVACHGRPSDPEARVAEQVARSLGWPIRFDLPELAYRGSLLETVRHNLHLADGFFATEPRHVPFALYGMSNDPGPGIVLGHIELQKAGWARNLREPRDGLIEYCRQRSTPLRDLVSPALTEAARQQVDAYAATLQVQEDAEYGYWLNYRFRVCRWLTSHYLAHSNELLPVYPLVDEKVARVVHCAPLAQLVSERLMFNTMRKAAPQLALLPLAEGQYRFEKGQPRRVVALPEPSAPSVAPPARPQMSHAAALEEACAHIRAGKLQHELRALSSAQGWAAIETPALAYSASKSVETTRLVAFLWTCYQASVLFSDGLD